MERWARWIGAFAIAFLVGITANNFAVLVKFMSTQDSHDSAPTTLEISADEVTSPDTPDIIEAETSLEVIEEVLDPFIDEDQFKVRLLTTGEGFRGDEVKAKNGEKWLGVFELNGKVELRPTRLRITRVLDEYVDDPESGQKTGKTVSTDGKGRPVFLLKNLDLPNGPVPTVFLGRTYQDIFEPEFEHLLIEEVLTYLTPNTSQIFTMDGRQYELKAFSALNPEGKPIYVLALETETQRQILHTIKMESNSSLGTLYWIGDLDGDGKPDLYLDLFVHYNVLNRVLFLSSQAESGQLVKKVAYFWTTGC